MSDINWNEAPEGATHWATCKGIERRWHMLKGGSLYFFSSRRNWIKYEKETSYVAAIRESLIPRPSNKFPKVGDECVIRNDQGYIIDDFEHLIGKEVKVMSLFVSEHNDDMAAVSNDGQCYCFRVNMLHPIPTEEELAVDEMVLIAKGKCWTKDICNTLYKAGYRKV